MASCFELYVTDQMQCFQRISKHLALITLTKQEASIRDHLPESETVLSTDRMPWGVYPWKVLPEKLGGGVRPIYQTPYPIYDQNLRILLPFYDLAETSIPY